MLVSLCFLFFACVTCGEVCIVWMKREEIDRRFAALENSPKVPEDVGVLDAMPKMLILLMLVVVMVRRPWPKMALQW